MQELAVLNPRRGRRHIMDLPHREGWTIGTRLMKRLRRAEGLLVVLDDFTRECPAIEVGRSCRGEEEQ